MVKIIVFRLGSLGDTVISLPALYAIKNAYPKSRIFMITNIAASGKAPGPNLVLENIGLIDEYINYPLRLRDPMGLVRLAVKIRSISADLFVNLHNRSTLTSVIRDYMFFRICGGYRIVGTPWFRRDRLNEYDSTIGYFEWEADKLVRRVQSLAIVSRKDYRWSLDLRKSEFDRAVSELAKAHISSRYIVICFNTKAASKQWSEPYWKKLVELLSEYCTEYSIVAVGAEEDFSYSANLLKSYTGRHINFCGMLTVRETAAMLKNADLYIGLDSGVMHLAGVMNTPSVIIFSAQGKIGRWLPAGKNANVEILYKRVPCMGCEREVCPLNSNRCLKEILPEEVFQKCREKLYPKNV